MKHIIDISKYTLYKNLTDENLLIAVPVEYSEQIKLLVKEHGSLANVPSDKTVRGIFVKNKQGANLEMLTSSEQQNDITVNQLKEMC